jgi:hypothetical protein
LIQAHNGSHRALKLAEETGCRGRRVGDNERLF